MTFRFLLTPQEQSKILDEAFSSCESKRRGYHSIFHIKYEFTMTTIAEATKKHFPHERILYLSPFARKRAAFLDKVPGCKSSCPFDISAIDIDYGFDEPSAECEPIRVDLDADLVIVQDDDLRQLRRGAHSSSQGLYYKWKDYMPKARVVVFYGPPKL